MPKRLFLSLVACILSLCLFALLILTSEELGVKKTNLSSPHIDAECRLKVTSSPATTYLGVPASQSLGTPVLESNNHPSSGNITINAFNGSEPIPMSMVTVPLPAVFSNPETIQSIHDPQIRESLVDLAEEFVREVNGSGVSPSDPRYGEIWVKARERADEQIRLQYGQRFLNELR